MLNMSRLNLIIFQKSDRNSFHCSGFSNGGNAAIGVNPSGVRVNATPATYAGAAARAMPPAKSPGIAAPAGICPRPAVKPCGNAAAPPPKAATRAPAESSAPLNPPSWKNRQNDILEKSF